MCLMGVGRVGGKPAYSSVSHWFPFQALILCDNAEPCISQVLCRTAAAPMYLERYLVDCERYLVGTALQKSKFFI